MDKAEVVIQYRSVKDISFSPRKRQEAGEKGGGSSETKRRGEGEIGRFFLKTFLLMF